VPTCIQAAWAEHKKVHTPAPDAWLYCTKGGKGRSMVMPDFKWTGSLRPWKVSPARPVSGSQAPSTPWTCAHVGVTGRHGRLLVELNAVCVQCAVETGSHVLTHQGSIPMARVRGTKQHRSTPIQCAPLFLVPSLPACSLPCLRSLPTSPSPTTSRTGTRRRSRRAGNSK
jgi:hypothetical protein